MSAGYLAKCAGKIRHESKEAAMTVRRAVAASGKWRMSNTNVYRCNQCGFFHIGHLGRNNRGKGRG